MPFQLTTKIKNKKKIETIKYTYIIYHGVYINNIYKIFSTLAAHTIAQFILIKDYNFKKNQVDFK